MPRPRNSDRSTNPVDSDQREVAYRRDGAHVRLALSKMEFEVATDAHEDLRKLTNHAQQYINEFGLDDRAKLDELQEEAMRWMESDDMDPNIPPEESNAPENNTSVGVMSLLAQITDQLRVVMDNVLEISRSQIRSWLAMCCSVVEDYRRGCIELTLTLKEHHYVSFLEAFLSGKIYQAVLHIVQDNTLDSLKDFAYQGSSLSSTSAQQTLELLRKCLFRQDVEVVCPLPDLQNELFPSQVYLRIQVVDPYMLKKEVFAPETISKWVSNTARKEVVRLLQDIFDLQADSFSAQKKLVAEVKPLIQGSKSTLTEAQQQWSPEGERTKGVIAMFLTNRLRQAQLDHDMGDIVSPTLAQQPEVVQVAKNISDIADEIDGKFAKQFKEMRSSLNISSTTSHEIIYDTFSNVCRGLFVNDISWGKIIALLEFAFYLVKDKLTLLKRLIGFLIQFIFFEKIRSMAKSIFAWIMEQGGWITLYEESKLRAALASFYRADADVMYSFIQFSMITIAGGILLKLMLEKST